MHIAMIHLSNNGFPPDIRIVKEARALAAAGHHITICTKKTADHPEESEAFEPGIDILRAEVTGPPSWFQKRRANFTLREAWVKPVVEQFLDRCRPDIVHVHDFPYLPLVLDCAGPRGLPVVADFHENMPAAKRAWRSNLRPLMRLKASILFNYPMWQWHEKKALKKCERVIVVVPEAAERFARYQIPSDMVTIVSNTEDETTFNYPAEQASEAILKRYEERWMVSFIGGIGPHRGWDTALECAALAVHTIPNFLLTFVGTDNSNAAMIRNRAKALGVSNAVETINWQPFESVNSYIHASRVCLVPHNDFEHTQTTVPHKLFQYMICEKPILVSDCRPLKRIVEDADAGFVFKCNDARDMCSQLEFIHANPELARLRARNGRKAALGKYAWSHDAERLVTMYAELGRPGVASAIRMDADGRERTNQADAT
ncbi:glycosyltransferase family 4 protein [Pseudodesulfovibrio pelocollis]|uniref:glycosyltransferase family 4 protein n=1 Tax=Pseudodesulfovibrio pelocollis TaxID=3051432 RepID=UPI00255A71E7|nr:glycosyltransferase family 4 protein [Pseudodesulfovibrio sp. SB368]